MKNIEITNHYEYRAFKEKYFNGLIGLHSIIKEIFSIYALSQLNDIKKKRNIPFKKQALNMIFYGNPGTGKTTIMLSRAIKLARVYPHHKFLILTDSKQICNELREKVELLYNTNNNLEIYTYSSFIFKLAKKYNLIYMVDAAQSAGVYDIDVDMFNIDILAFPGHKGLLGPQGTGGLYIKEGITLETLREGGTGSQSESLTQPLIMPDRYESGTHNTIGIAGLGAGISFILDKGIENIRVLNRIALSDRI